MELLVGCKHAFWSNMAEGAKGSLARVVKADTPEKIPKCAVDGKITTVYWDICGLGQPIRYALELAGEPYVDVRVAPGPGEPGNPGYKQMWFTKKPEIAESVIFANLPYLFDGETALVQSNAILKYIGRRFNLMGDPAMTHTVDLALDQMADFDGESTRLSYMNADGLRPYCEEQLPAKLADWARLLGEKPFLTGDSISVADLKLYETLRKLRIIEASFGCSSVAACVPLMAFVERVEGLEAMQRYMKSEAFMERPLNNAHAQFK